MKIYFFDHNNRYIGNRELGKNEQIPKNSTTESLLLLLDNQQAHFINDKWVISDIPQQEVIEQSKELLIVQSNKKCEELILQGFELDLGSGLKHFGCSIVNQANIDNLYHTAFLVSQGFPLPEGVSLEYNTSDDECIHPLTFEQCVALWVAKNAHVYKYRKACQDEKMVILSELAN